MSSTRARLAPPLLVAALVLAGCSEQPAPQPQVQQSQPQQAAPQPGPPAPARPAPDPAPDPAPRPASVPAAQTSPEKPLNLTDADLPPLPVTPYPAARPMEVVNAVFKFAARHPEVLSKVPCFCGCERMGHRGNDDCFVKSRDARGRPTEWEEHGLG